MAIAMQSVLFHEFLHVALVLVAVADTAQKLILHMVAGYTWHSNSSMVSISWSGNPSFLHRLLALLPHIGVQLRVVPVPHPLYRVMATTLYWSHGQLSTFPNFQAKKRVPSTSCLDHSHVLQQQIV